MQETNSEVDTQFDLLHAFNRHYEAFTDELQTPLRCLARKSGTFIGVYDNKPFKIATGTNPIYTRTPWLFNKLCKGLDDERFLDLALAGGLVSLASLLMDHLFDGQTEQPGEVAVLRYAFLQRGVDLFHHYFPWKTPFWNHFKRLHREHLYSLEIESALQAHPKQLSSEEFKAMAGGKASPVVITIAALAEKTGFKELFDPIEQSLKLTCIAGQLHDDVLDWSVDLEAGHLTHFLSQFLVREGGSSRLPDRETIQEEMDSGWQDVAHLEQAIAGYQQALAALEGLDCPAWRALVNGYLSAAESQRSGLIRAHVIRRLGQIDETQFKKALEK